MTLTRFRRNSGWLYGPGRHSRCCQAFKQRRRAKQVNRGSSEFRAGRIRSVDVVKEVDTDTNGDADPEKTKRLGFRPMQGAVLGEECDLGRPAYNRPSSAS